MGEVQKKAFFGRCDVSKRAAPRRAGSSGLRKRHQALGYWAGVLVDICLVKDEQDSVGHSLRGEPAALLHPLAVWICVAHYLGLYHDDIP